MRGPGIGTRFGTRGLSIGPHRGKSTTTAEFPAPAGSRAPYRPLPTWPGIIGAPASDQPEGTLLPATPAVTAEQALTEALNA